MYRNRPCKGMYFCPFDGNFQFSFWPFFGTLAHWMRETRGQISRVVRQGFECRRLCDADRGGAILIIGGEVGPRGIKIPRSPQFLPGKLHSHSLFSIFWLLREGTLYLPLVARERIRERLTHRCSKFQDKLT